ncbi:MFS transporter [Lactobacillus sp. ESL0236]|uniref:MFS transporter n=1 Tax=unclassified Lactobacillus TaxID=2620435 RepID=UPI000EFA5E80|nr:MULTISPECIES: MFS transporter [unclassified Lactobacillus]RMC40639.1 MFS transporter [Lactobacillus sp. ESL0237]RMC44397.1 MFS transporter [Lactobacillus sp. ESL0234]RMC45703.1 MFS transporter [Lactobacillus sp. ESL0236]
MDVFAKNKDYRKFTIASFLSGAGNILFYLALITYASKLRNYALAISLISISESVPQILQVFSGYLADRTKNKFKLMVWLAAIRFGLYLIVGLLFASGFAGWNLVLAVIGINLISDIAGSYSNGLQMPLVVNIVGDDEVAEAEGFVSGINGIINMIAQFIGSGLLLFMSYSSLAIFNALTFLAAGALFASVGRNYYKTRPQEGTTSVNEEGGFKTIALLNGVLGTIEPLISIVIAGNKSSMVIGTYSFTIALIGGVMTAGMALGSIVGTKLFKNMSLFTIAIISTALSIVVIGTMLIKNIFIYLPIMASLAIFIGTASPKLTQWLVKAVDQNILSSTMGMLNTILVVTAPVMTTIFTTITASFGITIALTLLGVTCLIILATIVRVVYSTNKNAAINEA